MLHAPCLYCQNRELHCHSTCNKYKEYKATRKLIKKKQSEEIMMNLYVEETISRFSGKSIRER